MFQRTFLTGFAFALLAAQACGSDDGKKNVLQGEAGMGGEAGEAPEPSAGGSSAGQPAVTAGESPVPMNGGAGAGGQAPVEPTAGAGGEEPLPNLPKPELLFSVKPGALGLANTGVSKAAAKQNLIYTSSTGSQSRVNGTNAVKLTGESMGLDPLDQIVAFAIPQEEPKNPTYLFSLADGSEGAYTTSAYEAYRSDSGNEEGKVYFSDGEQSYRPLGEGGDQYGYNALLATEVSLGLARGDVSTPDDLTGLAVHDANLPITELYFTVSSAATGAVGSAVAGVAADDRSCTVFKTELDGTNTVAFTCAQLGLAATADIDALAVYGTGAQPDAVVFSVTSGSPGAAGSALEAADTYDVGAMLFRSSGNNSNTRIESDVDLGLGENNPDEIDGLAVIDQAKGSAAHVATCELTYDPLDAVAGGGLSYIYGSSGIGNNVMVVFGQTAANTARALAYDATTCAFLQQHDLPAEFSDPRRFAIVPATGWSAAKPLDKVEYYRAASDGLYGQQLDRYDADGVLAKSFPIANTDYSVVLSSFVYDATADRLFAFRNVQTNDYYVSQLEFTVLPRPKDGTTLTADFKRLTTPCAATTAIAGVDGLGNLYVASPQSPTDTFRVCAFTPKGGLLPAPYTWTSDTDGYSGGFIVPGAAHFLLHGYTSPITIERGAYTAP